MSTSSKAAMAGLVAEQEMLLPEDFDASAFSDSGLAPIGDVARPGDDETVVLHLADLVPDEQGEVVVFNDTAAPLHVAVEGAVVASGLADPHVTSAGIDVTGMHFSMFDSGLTIYHDPETTLTFG
jgi:hypothetical protein